MILLEIRQDDRPETRTVEVTTSEVLLGKHAECDVVLADARVSKRHARLVLQGEGVLLEDLGSTNGTYLDGEPVTGKVRIERGRDISIGPFTIRIAAHRPPAAEATAIVST
ncbi:MAG: FHA domain-containing protein, partial [Candidatus Binatia bacterium]